MPVCTIMYTLRLRLNKLLPVYVVLLGLIVCSSFLVSCTSSPTQKSSATTSIPPTPSIENVTATATTLPTPSSTLPTLAHHYTNHVLLQGGSRPDDLAFDKQGHLLFSNPHNGTVNRLNSNGTITVLLRNLMAPEGLLVLPDGMLVIAEQGLNRILTLATGATTPIVLRQLPGTPSTATCKDGIDGIALDPTTNTIIIPDSPSGEVYRLSLNGKTLTLLATGIVRPVGAAVDAKGNIYIADECGGALWHLTPSGQKTRIGNFGMPDDVAFDSRGNILVTDLAIKIHALIRFNPTTGTRETLTDKGYIEPQGLLLDQHDNIFVSDDFANIIVEYSPA